MSTAKVEYQVKNTQEYPLSDHITTPFSHTLGGETFGYGVTMLSRVGFNSQRDQALVYSGRQSAFLSGSGHYYFLVKVNGAWIIQDKVLAWVS